jgi:hypothetical protein
MYSEKDIEDLVEMLYPYFIKKYKEDQSFKQTPQIIGAKFLGYKNFQYIKSEADSSIEFDFTTGTRVAIVRLAEEINLESTFNVPVITTEALNPGDYVYLMYWNDLKNARLFMKG